VSLGHAFAAVTHAAARQMQLGSNFSRPALLELESAEALLALVGGDMVKFAKNGSDVMNAAVRLARAFTGRDRVANCADHPFFSTGDWFIGTTPMGAGVPQAVTELTHSFRYNDLASLEALFDAHPGQIAAVVLEAETSTPPAPGFLESLAAVSRRCGALVILDEMITGFRWHNGGARAFHRPRSGPGRLRQSAAEMASPCLRWWKAGRWSWAGFAIAAPACFSFPRPTALKRRRWAAACAVVFEPTRAAGSSTRCGARASVSPTAYGARLPRPARRLL
jgi:hypothetical protein